MEDFCGSGIAIKAEENLSTCIDIVFTLNCFDLYSCRLNQYNDLIVSCIDLLINSYANIINCLTSLMSEWQYMYYYSLI